jgi:hypothetical protein
MATRRALLIFLFAALTHCQKNASHGKPMHKTVLVERISRNGDVNDPTTPRPLVTLEEFFDGNDDMGSIGYNFGARQPAPSEFYSFFKRIRARRDVADVRVEISQHDDPEAWPVTDTIWIVTSASDSDVSAWLGDRFAADDLLNGLPPDRKFDALSIPAKMRAVGVWWD